MWKVISFLLPWFIGTIVISQVIIPLIVKSKLFWLFRKKQQPSMEGNSLEEEVNTVQEEKLNTGKKISEVKNKVNQYYEEAEKLKRKSDSI